MRPSNNRRSPVLLAAAVAASGAVLALGVAPSAQAAPGDNGDVKVHGSTTALTDQRNEPKVCSFYLDAFNFDTVRQVSFTVDQQWPTGRKQVLAGGITLANGTGHTEHFILPNGRYKLNWAFQGEKGRAKHKVFRVACQAKVPPGPMPSGGVAAGGGGSVRSADLSEVAAGSALLAIAAGLGLRSFRRRWARGGAS